MIIGTFSKGIHRLKYLDVFLDANGILLNPNSRQLQGEDVVVGWGRKRNTERASAFSSAQQIPFVTLEDGFIRSVGLGREGVPSLSLVADPVGIYFDATQPSLLENILNGDVNGRFDDALLQRANEAMSFILANRISKYNGAPSYIVVSERSNEKRVLVVDQVKDDASVRYGMNRSFDLNVLVKSALEENPRAEIYVKLHPETIAGFRQGGVGGAGLPKRVKLIEEDVNPISLLEQMDKIYVATSQMGFEALMLGKEVVCFGMPFYAGWGLTDDRMHCPRRVRKRSVTEVFAAAYILYSRYVNPHTGKRCDIMTVLRILKTQVDHNDERRRDLFCFGIRHWKRYNILPFLRSRKNRVVFVKTVEAAVKEGIKAGDEVVVWGAMEPAGLEQLLSITGTNLLRMEDGFLRSVGLGSDFARPSSLVIEAEGIYFDPSRPSRLERVLQQEEFNQELLASAQGVRENIIAARLSKYNHEQGTKLDLSKAANRKVVFIPGQVADDASISKGCMDIADNPALIRVVREKNPDAFIIYKPHPDVTSGNRKGKVSAEILERYCDLVVEKASIPDCLEQVHEVHTMTSLVGFEALMREISVHVYGRPFYAGWGLTTDRLPLDHRTRRLSIDELVAGALLLYPEYYDWDCGYFTDCEQIIEKLSDQRRAVEKHGKLRSLDPGYMERQLRKMALIIKGLVHAC